MRRVKIMQQLELCKIKEGKQIKRKEKEAESSYKPVNIRDETLNVKNIKRGYLA